MNLIIAAVVFAGSMICAANAERSPCLQVEYLSPVPGTTVRPFLFSPELAPSTVENLRIAASMYV